MLESLETAIFILKDHFNDCLLMKKKKIIVFKLGYMIHKYRSFITSIDKPQPKPKPSQAKPSQSKPKAWAEVVYTIASRAVPSRPRPAESIHSLNHKSDFNQIFRVTPNQRTDFLNFFCYIGFLQGMANFIKIWSFCLPIKLNCDNLNFSLGNQPEL